eukprot:643122-Pyramimonas_sp.AAC.1
MLAGQVGRPMHCALHIAQLVARTPTRKWTHHERMRTFKPGQTFKPPKTECDDHRQANHDGAAENNGT